MAASATPTETKRAQTPAERTQQVSELGALLTGMVCERLLPEIRAMIDEQIKPALELLGSQFSAGSIASQMSAVSAQVDALLALQGGGAPRAAAKRPVKELPTGVVGAHITGGSGAGAGAGSGAGAGAGEEKGFDLKEVKLPANAKFYAERMLGVDTAGREAVLTTERRAALEVTNPGLLSRAEAAGPPLLAEAGKDAWAEVGKALWAGGDEATKDALRAARGVLKTRIDAALAAPPLTRDQGPAATGAGAGAGAGAGGDAPDEGLFAHSVVDAALVM